MKKVLVILLAAMAISVFAADATVKGYLVDMNCAREEGSKPDFGAKHTRDCLQMPDCVNSGYGILTEDKRILKFDKAGNERAQRFIADLKKDKDIRVIVTGRVTGNSMTVSKIELQ